MDDTEIYLEHENPSRESEDEVDYSEEEKDEEAKESKTDGADNTDEPKENPSRLDEDSGETFKVNHEDLEAADVEEIMPQDDKSKQSNDIIMGESEYPLPTPEVGNMQPLAPPKHANRIDNEKAPS